CRRCLHPRRSLGANRRWRLGRRHRRRQTRRSGPPDRGFDHPRGRDLDAGARARTQLKGRLSASKSRVAQDHLVASRPVQWPAMDGRDDVPLTNLDQPLFDEARATKRDLVDYFEAVSEQLLGELRDRPLSVVRALRGQKPFMQKNVPKYAPPWIETVTIWAERSKRDVDYALCNDGRTLLWFANQRAIEYHPTLARTDSHGFVQTHLVLDLDPPPEARFDVVARVAELVRRALADAGLAGAVKTSGAKGLHVFVPIAQ